MKTYIEGMSVEVSYLGKGTVIGVNDTNESINTMGYCRLELKDGSIIDVMPNECNNLIKTQVRNFRVKITGVPINL